MCGIAGILDLDGAPVQLTDLERMIATLRHRGPDDVGFHRDGQLGFGHARLSILDISGGHQPMCNEEQTLCVTFNGEIFNYVELREELIRKGHHFRTRSDTEVLLHLYEEEGEDCVRRLNGQWAFAIWDARKRRLFLSRDRFGIRPLYYTHTASQFLFASEIKALLAGAAVNPELDLQALIQIFTFWVTLPPRTAFKGISQLPPAHCLSLQDGRIRLWKYWELQYENTPATPALSEKSYQQQLCALLTDAVRIRLRSDVPVGTYLSGGLDSSLITAFTSTLASSPPSSFGVSFDDSAYDESAYQREAAGALNLCHNDVHCSNHDIAQVFPAVIRHTEQPIVRTAPAPLYLLSDRVHNDGYKVILTGEGADELFGGYDIFKEAKIRRFCALQPGSKWRPMLLRRLYPYLGDLQKQPSAYLQQFFHADEMDVANPFFSHLPRWQLGARLTAFLTGDVANELRGYDPLDELSRLLPHAYEQWHPFLQSQYLETEFLMPGYILSSQGDRMAMAHSVECRYPFLDYRVAEFAAKLPVSLKMRVLDEKYLLKRIADHRLPQSIVARPKQPYRAPEGKCFFGNGSHPPYVEALLSDVKVKEFGIFHASRTASLAAKSRSGKATGTADNMAIVGILSTQLLVDEFMCNRERDYSCQIQMAN